MEKGQVLDSIYTQLNIRHHSRLVAPVASGAKELSLVEAAFYTVSFFEKNIYGEGYRGWLGNTEYGSVDFLPVALTAVGAHEWSRLARLAGYASASDSDPDREFFALTARLEDYLWTFYEKHKHDLPTPDNRSRERWEEHQAAWKRWAAEAAAESP